MFRFVLLISSDGPSASEINDPRICVAVQASQNFKSNVVREHPTAYLVDTLGVPGKKLKPSFEADIRAIREVRENYAVIADYGLNKLSSALVEYESEINESLASESHSMWKSGQVISVSTTSNSESSANQIFVLDTPQSWIDIAAASMLTPTVSSSLEVTSETIYEELKLGHLKNAKDQLRQLCRIRLGEPLVTERIEALFEPDDEELVRLKFAALLLHDLGYPPDIAALWLIAFALEYDADIETINKSGYGAYISSDNIADLALTDISFSRFTAVQREKSTEWNAVLPFLKLIVPHANETRFGGGRATDAEEFDIQLQAVAKRIRTAYPVMQSLEIAAVAIDRPLTSNDQRLIKVLGTFSWLDFVVQARQVFGSVPALRSALSAAALRWAAIDSAPEIEHTIYYLDRVEFGRIDHSLAIERQLLRSRFDLKTVIESPSQWWSIQDDFQRWRQDYRRAYLEDHAQKQEQNKQLQQKISSTTKQVEQIELFEQIGAIRLGDMNELPKLWDETIRPLMVCEYGGAEIRLIDGPVCPECRGRLGQPPNHVDIADMISEIERLFIGYRDRLAAVVSNLVLNSPDTDKLVSLFRLNSAGDLSDLANVLDDKVISFLNNLFGKPGDTSGSNEDWASPHS